MKKVKILGTGCPKCMRTTTLVEEVIKDSNIEATVEKVDDIMEIMKYDILTTPAVVVDERVTIKGRVPTKSELVKLFEQ